MRALISVMGLSLVALLASACGGGEEAPSMVSPEAAASTAKVENRKPGNNSWVTAAPPTFSRPSSTSTRRPAFARYAAATSPL